MTFDLWIFFKSLCVGFFYSFLLIREAILVSYYVVNEKSKYGMISSCGIIGAQTIWILTSMTLLFFIYKKIGYQIHALTMLASIILFIVAVIIYRSQENYDIEPRLKTLPHSIFLSFFSSSLRAFSGILGYSSLFIIFNAHLTILSPFQLTLSILGILLGSTCFWISFILTSRHFQVTLKQKILEYFHQCTTIIFTTSSFIGLLKIYF